MKEMDVLAAKLKFQRFFGGACPEHDEGAQNDEYIVQSNLISHGNFEDYGNQESSKKRISGKVQLPAYFSRLGKSVDSK